MKKIVSNKMQTMLIWSILPLWLMSFFFGRASVAVVEVAQSQALTSNKAGARQAAEHRAAMDLNVDNLVRPKHKAPKADPFATYIPQPRALPAAPPPPAPSAPSLPFTFLGRMVDSDSTVIFLSKQDQSYIVKINSVLDKDYRVDMINNDQVVFTYLPLNIQQTLSFGQAG